MADPAIAVTVRYFAAARAAAGTSEERIALGPCATVADALSAAAHRHGEPLVRVLARCSYLLDEVAVHGDATAVADGSVLDVLPPFAGG